MTELRLHIARTRAFIDKPLPPALEARWLVVTSRDGLGFEKPAVARLFARLLDDHALWDRRAEGWIVAGPDRVRSITSRARVAIVCHHEGSAEAEVARAFEAIVRHEKAARLRARSSKPAPPPAEPLSAHTAQREHQDRPIAITPTGAT